METTLELDVLIFPDEVRIATPEDLSEWELETASQLSPPPVRLFVALYPYNPAAMSPNHDTAAEELPFVPGQIIKVKDQAVLFFPICLFRHNVKSCLGFGDVLFSGALILTNSYEWLVFPVPISCELDWGHLSVRYDLTTFFVSISCHNYLLGDVISHILTLSPLPQHVHSVPEPKLIKTSCSLKFSGDWRQRLWRFLSRRVRWSLWLRAK